ncbi:MAG: hypothetical protein AB1805_15945 [Nitrospirota bacterium]
MSPSTTITTSIKNRRSSNGKAERLLFRRQFIMGRRFVDGMPSWQRVTVDDERCLTVHPDLPVCQERSGGKGVTLLGYLIDPGRPSATDADILRGLLSVLCNGGACDTLRQRTAAYGGRWILIVSDGAAVQLFTDPAGFRQVFYTDVRWTDELWCASQPGLIADILGLQADREAMDFIVSFEKRDCQFWWPGDSSPYREVRHLLPNHALDLSTGSAERYWPDGPLPAVSFAAAVERLPSMLKGLMGGAFSRFDPALSMTAGRDTRLVLAASRAFRDRLFCFSMKYWDMTEESPDITIPSRLLSRMGIGHTVIPCPSSMDRQFERLYNKNVATAREVYGVIAQGLDRHYPKDRVCVKGNAVGIAKCFYKYALPEAERTREVTPGLLARLANMGDHPFAIRHLDRWLSGADLLYNVEVLDLFKWENREGNWQAMSQLEWDIVQEVFVPFNCRDLLVTMLSVDEQYRRPPSYALNQALIASLWPELLDDPINPRGIKSRSGCLKDTMKSAVERVRVKAGECQWWKRLPDIQER